MAGMVILTDGGCVRQKTKAPLSFIANNSSCGKHSFLFSPCLLLVTFSQILLFFSSSSFLPFKAFSGLFSYLLIILTVRQCQLTLASLNTVMLFAAPLATISLYYTQTGESLKCKIV